MPASTPLSPGMQANFRGFTFVNESSMDHHMRDDHHDRMDEDLGDDEEWVKPRRSGVPEDHRMSGVIKSNEAPDGGIFGDDYHFDM
jgi:protein-serine/threonine kinase